MLMALVDKVYWPKGPCTHDEKYFVDEILDEEKILDEEFLKIIKLLRKQTHDPKNN